MFAVEIKSVGRNLFRKRQFLTSDDPYGWTSGKVSRARFSTRPEAEVAAEKFLEGHRNLNGLPNAWQAIVVTVPK